MRPNAPLIASRRGFLGTSLGAGFWLSGEFRLLGQPKEVALNARIRVAQAFLDWKIAGSEGQGTTLRRVRAEPGIFDNVPNHTQTFWGTGFTMPRPFWKIANIGVYYIGFDNKKSVFSKGIGRKIRETGGVHVWKRSGGGWDYDDEAVTQWGSFHGVPTRAWKLSAAEPSQLFQIFQ